MLIFVFSKIIVYISYKKSTPVTSKKSPLSVPYLKQKVDVRQLVFVRMSRLMHI